MDEGEFIVSVTESTPSIVEYVFVDTSDFASTNVFLVLNVFLLLLLLVQCRRSSSPPTVHGDVVAEPVKEMV